MRIGYNEKIEPLKQAFRDIHELNLINKLYIALREYEQQVNKKRAQIDPDKDISKILSKARELLGSLKENLTSLDIDDNEYALKILPELKATIKEMDQLVKEECLPTRLSKIHEAIKTLLRDLIALFAPLEGSQLINKATQTLTSCRSTLFSQVETMEKTLNPPEKTEQLHHYPSVVPRIHS